MVEIPSKVLVGLLHTKPFAVTHRLDAHATYQDHWPYSVRSYLAFCVLGASLLPSACVLVLRTVAIGCRALVDLLHAKRFIVAPSFYGAFLIWRLGGDYIFKLMLLPRPSKTTYLHINSESTSSIELHCNGVQRDLVAICVLVFAASGNKFHDTAVGQGLRF